MSDKELIVLIILIGMLINVLIILGGNMNKQEAIDELKKHKVGFGEAASVRIDRAVSAIRQINEPQKVVVPKFVAEWIGELKESYSKLAWVWQVYPNEPKIKNWLEPNTEKFMSAWIYGYTVEKEKLYTVEIPNPNLNAHTVLQKTEKGIVLISVTNARWRGWSDSKLTESEIKQDFEWAWDAGFAKPVEAE